MFGILAILGVIVYAITKKIPRVESPKGFRPNVPPSSLGGNPLESLPTPSKFPFEIEIRKQAKRFKVPVRLMVTIADIESNFNPKAVNLELESDIRTGIDKDSLGLFQILWPHTALALAKKEGIIIERNDLFNVEINTMLAASLLHELIQRHSGNFPFDVISSYNGPGKPRFKPDGTYFNQAYVDRAKIAWEKYSAL